MLIIHEVRSLNDALSAIADGTVWTFCVAIDVREYMAVNATWYADHARITWRSSSTSMSCSFHEAPLLLPLYYALTSVKAATTTVIIIICTVNKCICFEGLLGNHVG